MRSKGFVVLTCLIFAFFVVGTVNAVEWGAEDYLEPNQTIVYNVTGYDYPCTIDVEIDTRNVTALEGDADVASLIVIPGFWHSYIVDQTGILFSHEEFITESEMPPLQSGTVTHTFTVNPGGVGEGVGRVKTKFHH